MHSSRPREYKPAKSKKDKKLSKLLNNSDSDTGNESEHELSRYVEDRVKLMKEVLKIIKPKKIKTMAPDCMKKMQIEEINSMLLEELLGISNKRLKYIFEGKNLDEESSTDEDQPIDVISLDDISDDDFVIISDDDVDKNSKKKKRKKIKEEPKEKSKKIKKEKPDREREKSKNKEKDKEKVKGKEKTTSTSKDKEPMGEENLMSVLELLELQARARAIRSQLDLESKRKKEEQERLEREKEQENGQDDDEEIIIEVPKEVEIIITSSDSENEEARDDDKARNKKNTFTNDTGSKSLDSRVKENTNNSNIEILEESSRDSTSQADDNKGQSSNEKSISKTNTIAETKAVEDKASEKRNTFDKEEGEAHNKGKSSGEGAKSILNEGEKDEDGMPEKNKIGKDNDMDSPDSGSDSNDNLQTVMLREKRKKIFQKSKSNTTEIVESENSFQKNVKNEKDLNKNDKENSENSNENASKDIENKQQTKQDSSIKSTDHITILDTAEKVNESHSQSEDNISQQSQSKIEDAIAEFVKAQPPPLDETQNVEESKKEAKKHKEKETKEKRLKNLKNKLQSYKKDVEGESSVKILENIVIKPKVGDGVKGRVTEDNDDLVINVDQDDLDCIL